MPTHPILLAHGIARFDIVRDRLVRRFGLDDDSLTDHLHYFRHIGSHLTEAGFEVHHTRVGFAEGVEARAARLKAEVERVLALAGGGMVHIVGHSMGGLDARRMIVDHGMEAHVCSLTTVGTPHWGSSFADWGVEHHGDEALRLLGEVIDLAGFLNLTGADCAAFNRRAEAAEADNGVFYQTYACWEEERARVFGPLQLSWDVIKQREEGDNDGLVSVTSQRWTGRLSGAREKEVGQHSFPVQGDHLNEVGWWDPRQLSGRLRLPALLDPLALGRSLVHDRREYENQIKGTYLSIAQDLESRFPA